MCQSAPYRVRAWTLSHASCRVIGRPTTRRGRAGTVTGDRRPDLPPLPRIPSPEGADLASPGIPDPSSVAPRSGDGVDDLRVARAAAQVSGDGPADLLPRGTRVVPEEGVGGEDHPRVQKPHWAAPWVAKATWSGWTRPPSASPRRVTTSRPSIRPIRTRQLLTGSPSRSTVHVPHTPSPHPSLTSVIPRSSRRTWRRVRCAGARIRRSSPLRVSRTWTSLMGPPPGVTARRAGGPARGPAP